MRWGCAVTRDPATRSASRRYDRRKVENISFKENLYFILLSWLIKRTSQLSNIILISYEIHSYIICILCV